jgi:hypothetical protein
VGHQGTIKRKVGKELTKFMEELNDKNKEDQVAFTNIDNEDFVGTWGGVDYTIKAGETKTFFRYLTNHFTKHLINKIALREDPEGVKWGSPDYRKELEDRILGGVTVAPKEPEKTEGEIIKERVEKKEAELKAKKEEVRLKRAEILKKAREAKAKKTKKK